MNNLLNKKIKFENCLYIVFCIITIIYSIIIIKSNNLDGIRIFSSNILGLIILIISAILLISEITLLIINQFTKVKRILFYITLMIITLVIIDIVILGIIRSFIEVNNMITNGSRPNSLDPLSLRLAYICITRYDQILLGIWTTIWLSLAGTAIGLIIALLFMFLRTLEPTTQDSEFISFLKRIANSFVNIYVTIFRGTPMMVQAIIIFYFLPGILSGIFNVSQEVLNEILSASVAGLITVSLNTAAYLTEVLRGGIESLNKGQMEAARSLGMSRGKSLIYVVLPQAIKNSLPSICNEFIINIKDTSVLNVIMVMDLFFVIDSINGKNANQDAIFIAAIIYLILTYSISKILSKIELRMNLVAKPLPSCN